MNKVWTRCVVSIALALFVLQASAKEVFPDGTPIPDWFRQTEIVKLEDLGKSYRITDYGVLNDSTIIQTQQIPD